MMKALSEPLPEQTLSVREVYQVLKDAALGHTYHDASRRTDLG